jgi:teichuronic acid biosynthesis glycosyltransferase TuaC
VVGLPDDRLIVLFVGSLIPRKGWRLIAEAILGLGHPFLGVFVGDGPEAGYGRTDPRSSGLLDYRGRRENVDVIRYMSAADVLVLPAHGEGLPTVLVEAGAVGLPVIASAVGGIPDLLAGGRGTVLPEITVDAVTRSLSHFVAHRQEAEAAATMLQQHVRENHDADRNGARLLDLYRAIPSVRGGRE